MADTIPPALPHPATAVSGNALPLAALVGGAIAMGVSPVFVRLAEVGPFASAFWRVAGALPLLWLWAMLEARHGGRPAASVFRINRAIAVAGLTFAFDLVVWHLAIRNTSVANATFLATMMPVWVVLGSGVFLSEKVDRVVVYGLVLCLGGAAALIGTTATLNPGHLLGDIYGFATSIFFGAYVLAVRAARRTAGTGRIVFLSSLITAVVLLPVALVVEGDLLPATFAGFAALAALALVSHTGGQGFLTYALGHLPAAFSSLVIFLEGIAAALAGWLILSEPVSIAQAIGGALILLGIFVARPRRTNVTA